jgi:hypothetical protein
MQSMTFEDWLRNILATSPLALAELIVIITGLLIIARHRAKGVYLLCSGGIGFILGVADSVIGSTVFEKLVSRGWSYEKAIVAYGLVVNSGWALVMLLLLRAVLIKRNAAAIDSGFSVLPVADIYRPASGPSHLPPR